MEPPPFQEAARCDVCKCSVNTFRRRVLPQFGIHSPVEYVLIVLTTLRTTGFLKRTLGTLRDITALCTTSTGTGGSSPSMLRRRHAHRSA
ncbi:hypothetical protein CDL15_Pgr016517 [Punica granatum]|uniref:Uncharacterized protein n=1 Tax=Punica granatum TaxID=22663 RepID=A0A218XCV7_PUNGR|nr:hypothetical protein CDL15_Pgr016517 [Punica granatum]